MTEQEADQWARLWLCKIHGFFELINIKDIIRHPALLFDGRRAIDLLMEDSSDLVLERYENILLYDEPE